MFFYPQERLALFIDALNLHATARTLGFVVDFKRLQGFFGERGKLICAYYFTPPPQEKKTHAFLNWMSSNGYSVVVKPGIESEEGRPHHRSRNNICVDLAAHALMIANNVDHIVILSGDGNLRRLVEVLKRKRTRVTVISTLKTSPPMVTDQLRREADQFLELAELAPILRLSPSKTADVGVEVSPVSTLPTATDDQDRWEQIRSIWANARDRLEAAIKAIPDGRVRRKYESIARYSYAPIIEQLVADGAIGQETADAARSMNDSFLSLRTKKQSVSADTLTCFKTWKTDIDRQLPPVKQPA